MMFCQNEWCLKEYFDSMDKVLDSFFDEYNTQVVLNLGSQMDSIFKGMHQAKVTLYGILKECLV